MREGGKAKQAEKSFVRDSGKNWRQALREIKEAKNIGAATKLIKLNCKIIPFLKDSPPEGRRMIPGHDTP